MCARHCSLEQACWFRAFCRTGQPIQLRLSKWTWKQLLNEPIGLEDLKEVDDALHTSLTYEGSDEYDEVGTTRAAAVALPAAVLRNPTFCAAAPLQVSEYRCIRFVALRVSKQQDPTRHKVHERPATGGVFYRRRFAIQLGT